MVKSITYRLEFFLREGSVTGEPESDAAREIGSRRGGSALSNIQLEIAIA
jgi:hypothetical protein